MTEMFGEAWPPMSVPDLAPDDDNDNGAGVQIIGVGKLESDFCKLVEHVPHIRSIFSSDLHSYERRIRSKLLYAEKMQRGKDREEKGSIR